MATFAGPEQKNMIANVQHWTELIAKRLSGNIREDEARMLDAWVARDPEHQEYFDHLTHLWSVTGFNQTAPTLPDADWNSLEQRIQHGGKVHLPHVTVPKLTISRVPRRMLAAAAVLLLGVLSVTLLMTRKPVQTEMIAEAVTSVQKVLLPDGSMVTLRQGSTLRYDASFVEREVTLIGEAFFEVTRDESRPFSVAAGNGNVRVLGTKFNLKASADSPVELFVEEGQVAFAPGARKFDAKIFSAGQAGILRAAQNAEVERTEAPGINVTSWINGRLVFDHETLDHVLADISRHFAIPIQADSSLYSCELKADFENASLENVLETISFGLNLQVDKSGDTVVITGSPCATETEK